MIISARVYSSFPLARARQRSTTVCLCPVPSWSSLAGGEGIIFCKQMMHFKQDCSFLKIYIFSEADFSSELINIAFCLRENPFSLRVSMCVWTHLANAGHSGLMHIFLFILMLSVTETFPCQPRAPQVPQGWGRRTRPSSWPHACSQILGTFSGADSG